ncbi:MAG: hypothetical protein AB7O52_10545 [Planctomycetota bacterium]
MVDARAGLVAMVQSPPPPPPLPPPTPAPTTAPKDSCVCAEAVVQNGWCTACDRGYVAGIVIRLEMLWEALDAHGHVIDPDRIECSQCQLALAQDGFCESCRWGFVGQQLYYSRLTYLLARGQVVSELACAQCREASADPCWCGDCEAGMIGNVRLDDRSLFLLAVPELARLRRAIELTKQCRFCAVASFLDSRCMKCRIEYRNGQSIPLSEPPPTSRPKE